MTSFNQFEIRKHEDGYVAAGGRTRCAMMNEPWRAIDGSEETHSRVFKPDRQPKAEWLHGPDGVPHAQRKKIAMQAGLEIKLDKWAKEVREGVEKIIETGRVPSMTSQADLRACAQLLSAPAAPFQWSTDI